MLIFADRHSVQRRNPGFKNKWFFKKVAIIDIAAFFSFALF